jgi:nicotinamide mononucleotide (NMN) deamidase PncC
LGITLSIRNAKGTSLSATAWTELVSAIHAGNCQAVIAVTGGGSKAISQLLEVPGGSRTLLEAVVPYSQSALEDWLGGAVEQACSEPTARAMAMAAWMRARRLAPAADPHSLLGVGATASLASNRPKQGQHRVHVGVQTATVTSSFTLPLTKGARDRKKEEWLAAKLVLTVLGEAAAVDVTEARQALLEQLHDLEPLELRHKNADAAWTAILLGQRDCAPHAANVRAIFPGAYNPPHAGHLRMARCAADRLGEPVAYELSLTNVDKPPLDFLEIAQRLDALRTLDSEAMVLVTDAPTFRQKSALAPGCTFVVGADTLVRIADPRYYEGGQQGLATALAEIAARGCRFLVFGRQLNGRFQTLSDLAIPAALRTLCDEVPAAEFREDVSSTELRTQK